jgi:hypothetical protein
VCSIIDWEMALTATPMTFADVVPAVRAAAAAETWHDQPGRAEFREGLVTSDEKLAERVRGVLPDPALVSEGRCSAASPSCAAGTRGA